MNQRINYLIIILVLFLSVPVFSQGDPCEHLLDPNRKGSIALPDGMTWCDVARETGDAYAKCQCEHGKRIAAEKAKRAAGIKRARAQKAALNDKANEAYQKAYEINLTDDNRNFEAEKQAKIGYLEEYIRYKEQIISLVKEMSQRFQIKSDTKYTEQAVAHTRAEIKSLRNKEPRPQTLTITAASGQTNKMAQTINVQEVQNKTESMYAKRRREADREQRAREAQRKVREAEVQKRVAASQRRYEQTMANTQEVSNLIGGFFESQYRRIELARERKQQQMERQLQRQEREREAQRRREEERRRKAAEERKIKNAKSSFLNSIADVKIPLFLDHPQAYAIFVSKIGNETIKIIPATLYKNTDNQLPYKIDVIKKLKSQYSLTNLNTHGIYGSYDQLQNKLGKLYSLAQNSYINVTKEKHLEFGKKQNNGSTGKDFWGIKKSKTKSKSKKADDFWN